MQVLDTVSDHLTNRISAMKARPLHRMAIDPPPDARLMIAFIRRHFIDVVAMQISNLKTSAVAVHLALSDTYLDSCPDTFEVRQASCGSWQLLAA